MRISDWSSDVCSSDLSAAFDFLVLIVGHPAAYADLAYSGKGFAIFATQVDSLVLQSHKGGFFRVLVSVMIVIVVMAAAMQVRSEEHTSELQSLMRISYAVFCLKKKNHKKHPSDNRQESMKQPTTATINYTK